MYSDYTRLDLTRFLSMANVSGAAAVIHVSSKSSIHVSKLTEIRPLQMRKQGLLSHLRLSDNFSCKNL